MSFIIGRGRKASQTYPESNRALAEFAALGNYAEALGSSITSQVATAGGGQFAGILGAAIQVRSSGIVTVSCNISCSDNMTGDVVSHEVVLVPFTSPLSPVFSQVGGAGGVSFAGMVGNSVLPAVSQLTPALAPYCGTLTANANGTAANGLRWNGVALNDSAAGALKLDETDSPTLTGLLSANGPGAIIYTRAFTFPKSINPKVGWPVGTWLVAAVAMKSVTGASGTVAYQSGTLNITELLPYDA